MANLSTDEVFFHPQYYFIGHFSKLILPGSMLLETSVLGSQSYTGYEQYDCKYMDFPIEDIGDGTKLVSKAWKNETIVIFRSMESNRRLKTLPGGEGNEEVVEASGPPRL